MKNSNIYSRKIRKPLGYIVLWQFACSFFGFLVVGVNKFEPVNKCYNAELTTFLDGYLLGFIGVPIFITVIVIFTYIIYLFEL